MANFFFFTDIDKLNPQTNQQDAFGYSTKNGNIKTYKVSSMHSATSDPFAYAVCNGRIFIQDAGNSSDLVNLILKPRQQFPSINPCVKFYIYRGIKKSSLIDNSQNVLITPLNHLTNSIVNEYKNNKNIFSLSQAVLGIDFTQSNGFQNSDEIDTVFYANNNQYQLWDVQGGWSIGTFDKNSFGFEIILDDLSYNPTLDIVRTDITTNHSITINENNVINQKNCYLNQIKREEILHYIDPCAFYGNFYNCDKNGSGDTLMVRSDSSVFDYSKAINDYYKNVTSSEFYSLLFKNIFCNQNVIYVDIRNELNDSFDFQNNYGTVNGNGIYAYPKVKISFKKAENNLIETDFYDSTYQWPLLKINNNFDTTESNNYLNIAFPLGQDVNYNGKGRNNKPLLYIANGFTDNNQTGNPNILQNDEKFVRLIDESNYSSKTELVINRNSTDKKPICSYIKLNYIRQQEQIIFDGTDFKTYSPINGTILNSSEYLDNIFQPFEMYSSLINVTSNINSNIYYDDIYLDFTRYTGKALIVSRGIAVDTNNITFFAFAKDRAGFNADVVYDTSLPFLSGNISNSSDLTYIQNLAKTFSNVFSYNQISFTTKDGVNVTLDIIDNKNIGGNSFTRPSGADFESFSISKTDWTIISGFQTNFIQNSKVYMGFIWNETGEFLDLNANIKRRYVRYEIVLRGFVESADKNSISFVEVPTGVYCYSVLNSFDVQAQLIKYNNNVPYNIYTPDDYTQDDKLIENNSLKDDLQDDNSNSSSNTKKITIQTTLYLARGSGISQIEFLSYVKFFKDNIRKIWTTSDGSYGNIGLQNIVINGKNITISIDDVDTAIKGVQFKIADYTNFSNLGENEVFVYVNRDLYVTRSKTIDRQKILMIYGETTPNTPAHEFGHILGLADRYTQVAIAKLDYSDDDPQHVPDDHNYKINPYYGRQPALYLPPSYDLDYTTNYRWNYNLMSTLTDVPSNVTSLVAGLNTTTYNYIPDFVTHQDFKDYYTNFAPTNPDLITIFITQKQLEIVINKQIEESLSEYFKFPRYVFFYNGSHDKLVGALPTVDYFNGSFVGVKLADTNDLDDCKYGLVTDKNYHNCVQADDIEIDGNMNLRCRYSPNIVATKQAELDDTIKALFSPYFSNSGKTFNQTEMEGNSISSQLHRNNIERGENGGTTLMQKRKHNGEVILNEPPEPEINAILKVISEQLTYAQTIIVNGLLKKTIPRYDNQLKYVNPTMHFYDSENLEYMSQINGLAPHENNAITHPDELKEFGDAGESIKDGNQFIISNSLITNGKRIWKFRKHADTDMYKNNINSLFHNNFDSQNSSFRIMWDAYLNRRIIFYLIEVGRINTLIKGNNLFSEDKNNCSVSVDIK